MIAQFPHLYALVKRLLLAFGIMSLCRLIFLWFNYATFSAVPFPSLLKSFIGGVWFDCSAIMYFLGPVILLHVFPAPFRDKNWYQKLIKWFYVLGVFLLVLLNFIDTGYFTFTGKRSGFELIKMQGSGNAPIYTYLADYWFLLLLLLGLVWAVWKFYPKTYKNADAGKPKLLAELLIMIVLSGLAFIGARGGIRLKPLNTLDAAKIAKAELMPLTLNTPFQLLLTIGQVGITPKNYMPENQAAQLFNPYHQVNEPKWRGKNVVLIIVESLGSEYVGFYNKNKGFTPFLDSLIGHSTVYQHAYANGTRSVEGIPAIITSLPSWMQSDYINSFYHANTLYSTGYHLSKHGYYTGFFHGGKNGTMSFDRFVASSQSGDYFGLNEYPNKEKDFDGNWGIPDEPYLQYVAHELGEKKQPFYSAVFTLSSHHPYQLPAAYQGVFKGGKLPIHATIEYADFSLKQFFKTAQLMPWYNNTIFMITADHTSESMVPYYQNSHGKFAIPLIVFNPAEPKQQVIDSTTIDQLSIMPLILQNTLPANSRYFSFSSKNAIQFIGGIYQLIRFPYVLKFNGEVSIGFYNMENDPKMANNLLHNTTVAGIKEQLERELKATIQQYNNCLIRNKTF